MLELNKVLLVGNLTRDPEVKTTGSGTVIADLSLAVNRRSGRGDDRKEEVVFVGVTAWDKTAEFCRNYLAKGTAIFVEGRLKQDSWEDKATGQKRQKLFVVAERIQFAGPKAEGGSEPAGEPPARPAEAKAAPAKSGPSGSQDDLPF